MSRMVEEAKKVFLGYSPNDTNDNYNTRFSPPKNFEFYFSKERCFRVSRKHYPQYTRGYLFGYYEEEEKLDEKKNGDGSIEREF